ncbi:MAG: hypothetical protein QXU98_13455 [Candidatus Parvarchaeota archaeon]
MRSFPISSEDKDDCPIKDKNDDVDSEVLAKLLMNNWIPESYVQNKRAGDIRRIVRTRIEIKDFMTSYENKMRF